jgi:hypothetical protein
MISEYLAFAYMSPIAMCAYLAMALFAYFVCGKGQEREFRGSWINVIVILFVMFTFSLPLFLGSLGGHEATLRQNIKSSQRLLDKEPTSDYADRWRSNLENAKKELEDLQRLREEKPDDYKKTMWIMFMAFPTTLALLFCYYSVSLVPVGSNRERSALDAAAGGLASVGANITTTEYDIIDMDTKKKVGETTDTTVGMGCMGLFVLAALVGLFAPFVVCFKFVVYQLVPFLTEAKT